MKWLKLLVLGLLAVFNTQAQTITFGKKTILAGGLGEISGLVHVKGKFYALNDGGNSSQIHEVDTANGAILRSINIKATNTDWEEMTVDDSFCYIGDFGNNKGNRKDLHILRFKIAELLSDSITPEYIYFSYKDQTDFSSRDFHNFDCEAMVSGNGGLFLFTKSRKDLIMNLYWIHKTPGNYSIDKVDSLQMVYMATGACLNPSGNLMLCGYDYTRNYAISYFTDWKNKYRFSGFIFVSTYQGNPAQYESIVSTGGSGFLMASESLSGNPPYMKKFDIMTPALHRRDPYLQLESLNAMPNEFVDDITVTLNPFVTSVCVLDKSGKKMLYVNTTKHRNTMPLKLGFLSSGSYSLLFKHKNKVLKTLTIVKI